MGIWHVPNNHQCPIHTRTLVVMGALQALQAEPAFGTSQHHGVSVDLPSRDIRVKPSRLYLNTNQRQSFSIDLPVPPETVRLDYSASIRVSSPHFNLYRPAISPVA